MFFSLIFPLRGRNRFSYSLLGFSLYIDHNSGVDLGDFTNNRNIYKGVQKNEEIKFEEIELGSMKGFTSQLEAFTNNFIFYIKKL